MNTSDSANGEDDRQKQIDLQAAGWVVRLDEGLSAAERRELDRWLAESPAHAAAFKEAQATWDLMGQLRFGPDALRRGIAPPLASPARAGKRRRFTAWKRIAALAACLILLAGGVVLRHGNPLLILTADHHTTAGAQRLVTLPDGSHIELGPASAVKLHFNAGARRIELLSGLAFFTAAPVTNGENRPFIVAAANGRVRALGTQFMVEHIADGAEVTVIERQVEVTLLNEAAKGPARVLAPGQAVRYAETGLAATQNVNIERATAWRRGRLIFDQVPLGEVVAALNRYHRGRIVITNAALGRRKVSGIFETAAPDAALAAITRALQINTVSLSLVILLY